MITAQTACPETSAFIFNIMRFATHDGPGIRTAVFFKGCPLSCWWCHNPESQSFLPERLYFEERCRHCLDCAARCPQRAIHEVNGAVSTSGACIFCGECTEVCMAEARQIAGRRYSLEELLAEVEKDLIFFDDSGGGVTLSGGEPAAQPAFAAAFLSACRVRGIRTAIETCGFAQPAVFRRVALAADLVLFDLKLIDPQKHRRYTGAGNELILANLEDLVRHGHPVQVRIPVVPGVNDTAEDIESFVSYLRSVHPPAVELLPYHRIGADKYRRLGSPYKLADTPQPAAADLAYFRDALSRAGLNATLGGSS
jgi:pyruvate formate lyase activating enzyme